MELNQVFNAILSGRAILIAGSGINYGSKNINKEQMPLGTSMAEELYNLAGVLDPDDKTDLQDASNYYIEKNSKAALIAFLQNKLSVGEMSDAARQIYSLPWLREYTTNYDQIPILAANNAVIPITIDSRVSQNKKNSKRQCVYINGYLGNLNESKLDSSFKLTTKSYLSSDGMLNSEWGVVLREDIIRASAVVIIGLSLDYDLDLKRIVYGDSSKKVVIIDADNITQNKKDKLSKFGTVYAIGINEFANQLNTYKLNSYVETPANDRLINFCQNSSTNLHKKVNVQLMRDFLMWGKFDEALLGENVKGEKHIVFREDVDGVIDSVKKNIRVVFLHSNLGNGKTVFLEMLKRKLYDLGISTYEFIYQAEESIVDDLERIRNVEGKKVIIVENYFNHLSLLKQLSIYLNDEVTYVFTARTMIYDAKLNDVIEMMSLTEGQSEVIDINKLNNNELQQCYRMFENNSFWGDYTGHNKDAEKWKALKQRNKGKCEFNSILLEVMHSSDIQKRLIDLTDEIKKVSGSYYKCLIMMLISSVMSLELSADDIQNILNNSCFSDPLFIDNASVKELVGLNIRGNRNYKIKSAIVASEILRILDSNEDIISALISISEYADIYWRASEKYESILKNIVSFSHIKSFLKNKRNNIEFINDYYNALKNIGFHKENSFFWVQFSIATMYYGDYDLAQRYIDVAYKYFRAEGDNVPFQCDNQQARIKLLMIEDEKSSNVLDDFKNAHSLAMKPCKNIKDREESVIRLFKIYVDKRFIDSIEKAGLRNEYKKACGEAYNRTASFLKSLRNERDRDRYNNLLDELLKASTI